MDNEKTLSLRVPATLHRRLARMALTSNNTMKSMVREMIMKALQDGFVPTEGTPTHAQRHLEARQKRAKRGILRGKTEDSVTSKKKRSKKTGTDS